MTKLVTIIILCLSTVSYGQELVRVPSGIFQRVQVEHDGVVRQFERSMNDSGEWGVWNEWPAMDMRQTAHHFKPQAVHQDEVKEVLGPIDQWLDKRGCEVRVSGYYNFTNNPIYDWKRFAGDNYGTYTQTRIQLEKSNNYFLDLSKFRFPILKAINE